MGCWLTQVDLCNGRKTAVAVVMKNYNLNTKQLQIKCYEQSFIRTQLVNTDAA